MRYVGLTSRSKIADIFGELRHRSHQAALCIKDHGGTVENQFVLAAHQVHIDKGAGRVRGPRGQHALAFPKATSVVGRSVYIDNQLGPGRRLTANSAGRVPGVLADGYARAYATDEVKGLSAGAGHEVALFVEDGVIGQVDLVVDAPHLATCAHCGRVVEVDALIDKADDGCAALCSLGHLGKSNLVVGHEPRLEQEIFRWVTRNGQFGKNREVGFRLLCLPERVDYSFDIAGEVANHHVQLAKGDAQPCHEFRA